MAQHQWRPNEKETTKRLPIRLFKHVSRESEPKLGRGCGEGKEGASIGSGKEPTEAPSSIKHISTKENWTGHNMTAFSYKVTQS